MKHSRFQIGMLFILKKECFEQTLKFIEMQEKYFRMGVKGQLNKLKNTIFLRFLDYL